MQWPGLSYGVLPLTIMILVVIGCLIGYSLAAANVEDLRSRGISHLLQQNEQALSNSFNAYARLQWGNAGWIESQRDVDDGLTELDEPAWRRFISAYNLQANYPGMEAIGVSYGDSPQNNVIRYVSPATETTQKTVGFDMGTSAPLSSTMKRAAQSGQTTISPAMPRLFSTKQTVKSLQTGFLMYTPFFDSSLPQTNPSERAQALRGFIVTMLRGDIFFDPTLKQTDDLSHTKIHIYLGEAKADNLLYQNGTTTDNDTRSVKQQIHEFGQTFTVNYVFDTAYVLPWSTTYFPLFLLFGGVFFGLLFASLSGYMLRNRYHRLTYEKDRDIEFAKDELLSLASHQLRTPATGVKQYLGMVLQGFAGDVTGKQREYLERAYASNNRQLGVINDILHLAKLETGRIVLAESKFDIAKMVRDVVDEQRESAAKGELTLHLEAPPTGIMVGDSHMLRMVIENLVSNAIKYTPPNGVVSVRLVQRANRWVIMVKDTGVGIAKSDFNKLFKQFTRINNPRSEFVTGTGVGLYLAYHLTVLHGGTISVTSKKGKGSTFTVRLPKKIQRM